MTIRANEGGLWTCTVGAIRITTEGQPSVFDMIEVLGGQKDPHKAWARIAKTHPEVPLKCRNLIFPGRGQRLTPVAKTKKDAYYILGLLPGAVGRKYREQAAKLFASFLDDPSSVASAAIKRMSDDEQLRLEARLSGIRTRHKFTDVLKEFGVLQEGYARCTNAVYVPILGADANGLKLRAAERTGLAVKQINPRNHMTIQELTDLETAERVSAGQLRRQRARGNSSVERVVRHSAEYTRRLLDGEIDIPSLPSHQGSR